MLNWTERMIRVRKECPEISWGNFTVLRTNASEVLDPHAWRWFRVGGPDTRSSDRTWI
jgi:hypothetical protein